MTPGAGIVLLAILGLFLLVAGGWIVSLVIRDLVDWSRDARRDRDRLRRRYD